MYLNFCCGRFKGLATYGLNLGLEGSGLGLEGKGVGLKILALTIHLC